MQHINVLNFLIFETIIVASLFIICLKLITDIKKQKENIDNLRLYNETLQKMYDGIRCFKHDFVNFIQALEGYIKCNDIDGITSMVDSIYTECKSICNIESLNPEVLKNSAIYNLLLNKYNDAYKKGIIINFEINTDLADINVDTYKLSRILGILLDNAIEAAGDSNEKILNFRILRESDSKIVLIENSYKDIAINTTKIFEKGYTSKNDKISHGLGLWKVKEIISSTNSLNLNTNADTLFKQELKILTKKSRFLATT